jgi:hypothetical protein
MTTSESPETVRHVHGIKKVVLTLAPLPFCITPLLFKSRAARAWGVAPFKLIPRHQTVVVISRCVCTQVGSTASVIFDYREGFLFCEIAVDIEIAKENNFT